MTNTPIIDAAVNAATARAQSPEAMTAPANWMREIVIAALCAAMPLADGTGGAWLEQLMDELYPALDE